MAANATGCRFNPTREIKIYFNLYFYFFAPVSCKCAALSLATQHTMPSEFGGEWGMECLNTRFPLFTLLCARYTVKLILLHYLYLFLYFAMVTG